MNSLLSPLRDWVNGDAEIPNHLRFSVFEPITHDWVALVAIHTAHLLHEVEEIIWHPYDEVWRDTRRYVDEVQKMAGQSISIRRIQKAESQAVIDRLGTPPPICLPLYFISVKKDDIEKLVYVGQTTSNKRFRNGHRVCTALHHPKFNTWSKHIYQASLCVIPIDRAIALEWLTEYETGQEVLNSVEHRLINGLHPDLNRQGREGDSAKWKFKVMVENWIDAGFLHCETIE